MRTHSVSPSRTWTLCAVCVLALISSVRVAAAQTGATDEILADIVQRFIEGQPDGTVDADELLDRLRRLAAARIDLRDASVDELADLPGLDPATAQAVRMRIDSAGIESLRSLRDEGIITDVQLRVLEVASRIGPATDSGARSIRTRLSVRLMRDLEQRRGYRSTLRRILPALSDTSGVADTVDVGPRYLGSPTAILTVLDVQSAALALTAVFDKDAGEPIAIDDTVGYDYSSLERVDTSVSEPTIARVVALVAGSLQARVPLGRHTQLVGILGDYRLSAGAGLVLGSVSADAGSSSRQHAIRLTPRTTAAEVGYLRGIAAESVWQRGSRRAAAAVFASSRMVDASVDGDVGGDGTPGTVTSFASDGNHRTHADIRRLAVVNERLIGTRLDWRGRSIALGGSGYICHFDHDVRLQSGATLRTVGVAGFDARADVSDVTTTAEVAASSAGGAAATGTANASAGSVRVGVSAFLRTAEFASPHAGGVESQIDPDPVASMHAEVRAPVTNAIRVQAWLDLEHHPDGSYTVDFPTTDSHAGCEITWQPTEVTLLSGRLRTTSKWDRAASSVESETVVDATRTDGRLVIDWESPTGSTRIRGRVERSFAATTGAGASVGGSLLGIDCRFRSMSRFDAALSATIFRVDGFDAALYRAIRDLPDHLRLVTLSGEGLVASAYGSLSIGEIVRCSAGVSVISYTDRRVISPGSDQQIDGPTSATALLELQLNL